MSEYQSFELDGVPTRLDGINPVPCEWCGLPIPVGNLVIQRDYKYSNGFPRYAVQHLSCYQRTYIHCLEHGHTFHRFYMEPHPAIKTKYLLDKANYHAQLRSNC